MYFKTDIEESFGISKHKEMIKGLWQYVSSLLDVIIEHCAEVSKSTLTIIGMCNYHQLYKIFSVFHIWGQDITMGPLLLPPKCSVTSKCYLKRGRTHELNVCCIGE